MIIRNFPIDLIKNPLKFRHLDHYYIINLGINNSKSSLVPKSSKRNSKVYELAMSAQSIKRLIT